MKYKPGDILISKGYQLKENRLSQNYQKGEKIELLNIYKSANMNLPGGGGEKWYVHNLDYVGNNRNEENDVLSTSYIDKYFKKESEITNEQKEIINEIQMFQHDLLTTEAELYEAKTKKEKEKLQNEINDYKFKIKKLNEKLIQTKYEKGSKIKSHIYKRGTKIEKLSFEKIKQNIDNAYPTDAKQIKNQIDGVEREGFITIGKKLDLYNYWHKKFGETIDESIKNEKQHELDIAEYEFESSKNKIAKIDMNKLSVDALHADYPYKNAQWVWDNWTIEQRFHFLLDHAELLKSKEALGNTTKESDKKYLEKIKWHELNYEKLPDLIKSILKQHINEGRYEHGAKLHTHEYEVVVDKLSKNASINEIKTTTYGVDIIPYNSENDAYTLPIKLTIHELISLTIKSMKNENISNDLIKNELCERVKILLNE